jgi:hypothetical protein
MICAVSFTNFVNNLKQYNNRGMKYPIKKAPVLRPDLIWAKHKLEEVLFGCVLNIKLYQSGICPKLITEMTEEEMIGYTKMLDSIYDASK